MEIKLHLKIQLLLSSGVKVTSLIALSAEGFCSSAVPDDQMGNDDTWAVYCEFPGWLDVSPSLIDGVGEGWSLLRPLSFSHSPVCFDQREKTHLNQEWSEKTNISSCQTMFPAELWVLGRSLRTLEQTRPFLNKLFTTWSRDSRVSFQFFVIRRSTACFLLSPVFTFVS